MATITGLRESPGQEWLDGLSEWLKPKQALLLLDNCEHLLIPSAHLTNDLLRRCPNPHVTFGGGPYYCLGAPLARLEAQIALGQILERWPTITLDEKQVIWRDFINIRGLERLIIRV